MKTPAQTAFSDIRRKYSIIYADPPWMYNDGAQGKGAAFKYQLQDDEWLYNLPVESIAEDNAVLFLWATFPKMESALELIRRWGFTYKTLAFNWVKTTKNGKIFFGMGNWTRSNPEVCLLATRGKPKRVSAGISSVLMAPREEHSKMPILDYHCHINPKEIAEDRKFENITQVWLGGDHYKWRQMRTNGVDEKYITGDASDREKFQKWAETLEMAIGNPLYHWSHLELQRYFGYNGILNGDTAEEVWNLCNAKLQEDSMSVRNLIKQSNVTLVCTTDDPVDSLEWHQVLKDDKTFDVQVLPAWRPDKAMNIEKPEYLDYLETLSNVSGIKVNSFASLIDALRNRMDFFASMGCSVSDHALEYVMYKPYTEEEIEAIFAKRFSGSAITTEEMNKFKTAFMVSVGKEYNKRNWVMQLHYGTIRDNNRLRYTS